MNVTLTGIVMDIVDRKLVEIYEDNISVFNLPDRDCIEREHNAVILDLKLLIEAGVTKIKLEF